MTSPSAKPRVGILGLGQWGPNHLRNFSSLDTCEVVRVCDLNPARHALVRRLDRNCAITDDPRAITQADDIDAVVVATPVRSHLELVRQALEAGKDVLCEKPLAATVAECRELCDLARRNDRILMVGHVFLYNEAVRHLKRDLDSGELGRIYYMDAIRTNLGPVRRDVGAIHDLASHDISIFNHLLDAEPVEVSATGAFYLQEGIEDIGFITLYYPGNLVCHVHTSWLNPRKVRQLTVVGDRKMAVWDDMNNLEPIRYYDKGVTTDHYASFGEFQMILRDGVITIPKVRLSEPLLCQDLEFIDCIRTRRQPSANGEFGLAVARVLEAAMQSLRNHGRATALPPR